jgi:prepilin-type processing-associated H-X9-DG protein
MGDNALRVPFSISDPSISYSGQWEFWYATIAPYLEIPTNITDGAVWNGKRPPGVFACPSSRAKISNAANQATDYGYNIELHSGYSSGTARGNRLSKIAEPSNILIIADTQRFSNPSIVGPRDIANYSVTNPSMGMATRHGGTANCLFLDGRVEQIRPSDLTEAALKAPGSRFKWPYPWRPPAN